MLKLFDKTFFRMFYIFAIIIAVGFALLMVFGYYDSGKSVNLTGQNANAVKATTTVDNIR